MSLNDYETDLSDAVRDLVARGLLDIGAPVYGVALKAIYSGYDSLTPMQKKLYERLLAPALEQRNDTPRAIEGA